MILFHGSPDDDLEVLKPMPDPDGVYVWASPDFRIALAFARPWTDDDMEIRVVDDRVELRERRRGAFGLLKGPGTVYVIPDATPSFTKFVKNGKAIDFEYVSTEPVTACRVLHVPNVLHACYLLRFCMFPHGETPRSKQYVKVFVTGRNSRGILLHHYQKSGKWGPPSGRVEKGENLFVAAARELGERTGWTCNPVHFRLLASYTDKAKDVWHCFQVAFEDLAWAHTPQTEIRWSDGSQVKGAPVGDALVISGPVPNK